MIGNLTTESLESSARYNPMGMIAMRYERLRERWHRENYFTVLLCNGLKLDSLYIQRS